LSWIDARGQDMLDLDRAMNDLALTPPTKPGESPSQLRKWLEDEAMEYQAKAQ
jgi:hypothetical protein